jgi:hypothetical protein
MNKQLREFERESGLEIFGLGARRDKWELALSKYAELIVRECAEVAWINTPETEELDYSHLISNKIKQHFGVEE